MLSGENGKRVVLIGFRGAGKTSLARRLATRLSWPLYSIDAMVAEQARMSIAALVKHHGWNHFRALEKQMALQVARYRPAVVDTGGGLIEDPEAMDALCRASLVVWVDAPENILLERIRSQGIARPLLSGRNLEEDVAANYRRRRPLYQQRAQLTLNTAQLDLEQCCQKIVAWMEKQ